MNDSGAEKMNLVLKDETNQLNDQVYQDIKNSKLEYVKEVVKILDDFNWKNGDLILVHQQIEKIRRHILINLLTKNSSQKETIQQKSQVKQIKAEYLDIDKINANSTIKSQYDDQDLIDQFNDTNQNISYKQFMNFINSFSNPYFAIQVVIVKNVKKILKQFIESILINKIIDRNYVAQSIENDIFAFKISPKLSDKTENQIKTAIFQDLQVFIYGVIQIPLAYIAFFQDEFYKNLENIDIIDNYIDLQKMKKILYYKILIKMKELVPNAEYYIKILPDIMMSYVEFMSQKISSIYNRCVQLTLEQIEYFKKKNLEMKIGNKYLLVGLLRELSHKIYFEVVQKLESSFFGDLDPDYLQKFANYIIQNHDAFNFTEKKIEKEQLVKAFEDCQQEQTLPVQGQQKVVIENENEEQQQNQQQDISEQLDLKLKKLQSSEINQDQKFEVTPVYREDRHTGLLLKSDKTEYLVHTNIQGQVVVVNTQYVTSQWFRIKDGDLSRSNSFDINKNKKTVERYEERLENISKSKPLTTFISNPVEQIPPPNLGEIVVAYSAVADLDLVQGGLGWTALKIYKNKCANSSTKVFQAGKLAINAGSAVGGSLSGAALGQIIIPIPVLGALFGGIVGGFIGGSTSQVIIKIMNNSKYKQTIIELENNISEQGHWEYSRKNLDIYGITNKFLWIQIQKMWQQLYQKKSWRNMDDPQLLLLTIYILYERRIKAEQKENKEVNQNSQNDQNNTEPSLKYNLETVTVNNNNAQYSEWPQCILLSQQWLLQKDVYVGDYLAYIEKFLSKVLAQG